MIVPKIKAICISFVLSILLSYSCISDDYATCYGIRLFVNYPNDQERCDKLDIFVFDHKGALFAKYEKNGRQVQPGISYLLQLPEGQYNVVVWGDVCDKYSYIQDSNIPNHKDIQLISTENNLLSSDFWRYRVTTELCQKGLDMLAEELNPLFYASEYRVDLKPKETKSINLDFVKNTNKLKLKISGLSDGVSYDNLDVGVIARNWQYHFTNSIPENTQEIRYQPYEKKVEASIINGEQSFVADLSVLRLIQGRTPLLYVKNGDTGDVLYQRNLVELLLNLPYTDLDKEDYFEIELDFRGPTISIKINGWNVIDNNQDIS